MRWRSSNTNVARVDANGLVTAGGRAGVAMITATTTDGTNLSASATVWVNERPPGYAGIMQQMAEIGEQGFPELPIVSGLLNQVFAFFNWAFSLFLLPFILLPRTPQFVRPIRVGNTTLEAGQAFGAPRSGGRAHAGVDFAGRFGLDGNPLPNVYAARSGYVRRFAYFWAGTFALEVENDDGTILRYTELTSSLPGLVISDPITETDQRNLSIRVERGDVIGRLISNTYNGFAVLHLEHFNGTDRYGTRLTSALTNFNNTSNFHFVPIRNYGRRRDLLDPTRFHRLPLW